jgi:hypothetical protein
MKTLKESILSSTNTGKQKVLKEKIEKWCKNNITGRYVLENNIISCPFVFEDLYIKNAKEIPDYIKIGDIRSSLFVEDINLLKEANIVGDIFSLVYGDDMKIIDNKELIKVYNRFEYYRYPKLKSIKNLNIEFLNDINKKDSKNFISFAHTLIGLKDLKNVKAKNVKKLVLANTPATDELVDIIYSDKYKDNDELNKYINKEFSNFQGIKMIILKPLECHIVKEDGKWILRD